MRLLERALRRAQIPVSMTKGFNPRLKLSFPLALQLGVEGLNEIMELELSEWIKPSVFKERVDKQLPHGIEMTLPEIISRHDKSKIVSVVYNVILKQSEIPNNEDITNILKNDILNVIRTKGLERKSINIRPSIISIESTESGLLLCVKIMERGTGKPMEILKSLGIESKNVRITRTHINSN